MQHRHHGSGGTRDRHQELLYDPDIPSPSHAERARTLLEGVGTGTLCTLTSEPAGHPYGSFVTYGLWGPSPIFLISELAEHTQNLRGDPRASLLVALPGDGDPLARGRVTLVGSCAELADPDREVAKKAYLEAHPRAAYFADYEDFGLWRLSVERVRYIGGYGRMSWVPEDAWSVAESDPLAAHREPILGHMNKDHQSALVNYCLAFSKAEEVSEATMVEIDRYGFEMSAHTPQGPRPIRVAFDQPIANPKQARTALVDLAGRAREQLGIAHP